MERTLKHVSIADKDVLEVGCGDGRLTFKYAPMAKRVVAIDPKAEEIGKAKSGVPSRLLSKLRFQVGKGESLPFSDESFHVVLFTYSLCCVSPPNMKRALEESWRVLRPSGFLVDMQPISDSGHKDANNALKKVTRNEGLFDLVVEEKFADETKGNAVLAVLAKSGLR